MKSYTDIEPIPDYKSPRMWVIWPPWAFAVALTFAAPHSWGWWKFLAYVPFVAILSRQFLTGLFRHLRFNREIEAWDGRMQAHYANLSSQREKGIWS